MTILFVGIDLANSVFAVHGVDEHGKPALVRPKVARTAGHGCSARWVTPCADDAEVRFAVPHEWQARQERCSGCCRAICEAVQRPNMRFALPQKTATVRREAALHLENLPGWA